MHTHEWTPQETRTLHQNLHLHPRVAATVLPHKTMRQVQYKRTQALKTGIDRNDKYRQPITDSLRKRNWTNEECSYYFRATNGDEEAQMYLRRRGLWHVAGVK